MFIEDEQSGMGAQLFRGGGGGDAKIIADSEQLGQRGGE